MPVKAWLKNDTKRFSQFIPSLSCSEDLHYYISDVLRYEGSPSDAASYMGGQYITS